MADEKLVEREMLTNTYFNGTDYRPGDKIQLTEAQAKAWEELDPPAVAEVGHRDKVEQERRQIQEELLEREAKVAEHRQEQARLRGLHAQGRTADEADAPTEDAPASAPAGPKVSESHPTRSPRR